MRDPDRLEVRVAPWSEELARGALVLVAAPEAMWTEVAEPLLPRFPIGETGTVSLPWRSGVAWRLRLVGKGRGSWWQDLPAGRKAATLAHFPAADVTVTAVDEEGAPLTVVSIAVSERASRAGSARLLARYRTEDGTFALPALPDGHVLSLTATAPDRVPATFTGQTPDVPRRWTLERGARLAGRFVDSEGEPVPELRVVVSAWIGESTSRSHRETRTDAEGRWRLDDLPPGDTLLLAGKPGFAPLTRNLVLPPEGDDLGDVRVEASAELTLRVRDGEGAPIAGAWAEIAAITPRQTDAGGVARLEGLQRRRPTEITVAAEGYLGRKVRVRPPLPETLDVTLEAGFVVAGAYVDAQGAALDGAAVTVRDGPRTESRPLAADGRFELTLAPGRGVELILASPSSRPTSRTIAAGGSGQRRELGVIVADEGRAVSGRLVRSADAAPVAGALVTAPRTGGLQALMERLQGDLVTAHSHADGRFLLRGLGPDALRVRIEAPALARKEITISAAGTERGNHPLDLGEVGMTAGAEVQVFAEGIDAAGTLARLDLGNRWLETDMLTAPLGDDGWASFRHVPAGRATASVVRGRELLCEAEVEVADEEAVTVDCSRSGARVSGLVTVGGAPPDAGTLIWLPPAPELPGLIVRHQPLLGQERAEAFGAGRPQVDVAVAPGGVFATAALRAGAWHVAFSSGQGWTTEAVTIVLPDLEDVQVELEFPGLALAGRVVDAEGAGVAGARVRELASGVIATSGDDGRFRMLGLAAGTGYLKAYHEDRESAPVEVTLDPQRPGEQVVLELREARDEGLAVTVAGRDAEPLAGALVVVEAEAGPVRILTTREDGVATLALDPPYPERVRFAAFARGAWVLGGWIGWRQAREQPPVLALGPTGVLVLETEALSGAPEVVSGEGWNVSLLLGRTGRLPDLAPGRPARLEGLPPGTYRILLGEVPRSATVDAGGETRVELD